MGRERFDKTSDRYYNNKKMERKKIRIMSMQRIVNYGSFLQAYALKETIKSLGYKDVGFIDYEFEKDIIGPVEKTPVYKKIAKLPHFLSIQRKNKHKAEFKRKYSEYLKELDVNDKNYSHDFDTLVIGSDEVFNCLQHYPVGYSRNLFGYGFEDKHVISYAASFGHTKLDQLRSYGIDEEISGMLSRFGAISVRDKNSEEIIEVLAGTKPKINRDPVLIGDYSDAFDRPVDLDNYIIVYAYSGRLTKDEEKAIKKFAKENNKKIISLGFYQSCADENLIVEPLDVLAYFKNADYVITDTFHGSVFSIKANTKFCTIIRDSNRNKLTSLLKKMKCEKQIANSLSDIWSIYDSAIDFSETNKIIAAETEKTRQYLKENL